VSRSTWGGEAFVEVLMQWWIGAAGWGAPCWVWAVELLAPWMEDRRAGALGAGRRWLRRPWRTEALNEIHDLRK
jgi:hypothetical protein